MDPTESCQIILSVYGIDWLRLRCSR